MDLHWKNALETVAVNFCVDIKKWKIGLVYCRGTYNIQHESKHLIVHSSALTLASFNVYT
jgi:hypothetical protein